MIRFTVGPSPRNASFFGVKVSRSSAAETGRPWISRVTSRALNGEIRAYLYVDLTSIILNSHWAAHPPGGGPLLLFFPCLNPSPESPPRKSFDAHRLLAESQIGRAHV